MRVGYGYFYYVIFSLGLVLLSLGLFFGLVSFYRMGFNGGMCFLFIKSGFRIYAVNIYLVWE